MTRAVSRSGRVLLVAAIVAVLLAACGDGDDARTVAMPSVPSPGVTPVPGFADRVEPAVVAAGDQLFVFGGQRIVAPGTYEDVPVHPLDDGALVDIGSGKARTLPDAPFNRPLINPTSVKIGDGVLVIGDQCIGSRPPDGNATFCEPGTYAAARFDLKSHEWQVVAIPAELQSVKEGRASALGSTADGRAVFELGGMTPQYWVYSPTDERWTHLASGASEVSQACIADDQLVELSIPTPVNGPAATPLLTRFALSGVGVQRPVQVPGAARPPFQPGRIVCLADSVLVLGPTGGAHGAQRNVLATGAWSTVPDPPADLFGFDPLWTGEEVVFLPPAGRIGQPAFAFQPGTNTWRIVPGPPPITTGAVWDGSKIVGYAEPRLLDAGEQAPPTACTFPAGTAPTTAPTPSAYDACPPSETRRAAPKYSQSGVFTFRV